MSCAAVNAAGVADVSGCVDIKLKSGVEPATSRAFITSNCKCGQANGGARLCHLAY